MNRKNWLSALLAVMMVISMMACIALPAVAVSKLTQAEAENLPLASTATASDTVTAYQINSIDELLRASHAAVTTNPTANSSTAFKDGDTIYITADLDLATWDPSNFATYNEETGKYTTKGFFVANKGTFGDQGAYLKYSATATGVECDTKEEVFAQLWNGFNARAAMYTYIYADFDGLGHTISNLYTHMSFLTSDSYSTIRNLTFKNCTVDSSANSGISKGWTGRGHAIVMRSSGSSGAAFENVHLVGCNVISSGGMTGAFLDMSSNNSRPISMVNCSMVDCTINTADSQTVGLVIGNFRTKATLTMENILVANSKVVSPTRAYRHGLAIGLISNGGSSTTPTLKVNNVAVINCGEEYTTVDAALPDVAAFSLIANLQTDASADNIYYAGNTVTRVVKVAVPGTGTPMVDAETGETVLDEETGEPVIDPETMEYTEETVVTPVLHTIVETSGGAATAASGVKNGTFVTEAADEGVTVYAIQHDTGESGNTELPAANQKENYDLQAIVADLNNTADTGVWALNDEGAPYLAAGYKVAFNMIDPAATDNSRIANVYYTDLVTGKIAFNADLTAVDTAALAAVLAAAEKTGMVPTGSEAATDIVAVGDEDWTAWADKAYTAPVSYDEVAYASRVYVNDGIKLYQIHNIKELVETASFEAITKNSPAVTDKNGLTNDHTGWVVLDDATCTSTSGGKTYKSTTFNFKDLSTYATFVITDDLDINDYTSEYWKADSYTTADWDADHSATDAQKAFRTDYRSFMPATNVGSSVSSGYFGVPVVIEGLGHTISNFYDGDPFIAGYFSGAVRNLTFDNACVVTNTATAGVTLGTTHAILTRGGDAYSVNEFANVHIKNSYLGVKAGAGYIGAFTAYGGANKATHYWTVHKDCSVTNTTIYAPKATKYISLFAGQSGGATFEMYNCLAVGNTIQAGGTPNLTDGTPTIIANANHNNIGKLNFENVAAINNTFIGTETESPVSILAQWNSTGAPTVKIDNIYAVNNMRKVGADGEETPITLLIADRFNEFKLSNKKLNFTGVGGTSAGVTMIKHTTNSGYYKEADEIANTLPVVSTEAEAITKLNANGQNFADWYKNAEGDYVLAYAYNETQGKIYPYTPWTGEAPSLDTVLADVQEGDKVNLGIDFTYGNLVVDNYTLDVYGNTLTTTSLMADTDVVDASNGRGMIKGDIALAAANKQITLKDGEGYRLFDYEVKAVGLQEKENAVKYGFRLNFANDDAYALLAADTTATFTVKLTATALAEPITYTFDAYLINAYADYLAAGKNPAFTLLVSGLDNLTATDTLTTVATIASTTGVSGASAANAYEWTVA